MNLAGQSCRTPVQYAKLSDLSVQPSTTRIRSGLRTPIRRTMTKPRHPVLSPTDAELSQVRALPGRLLALDESIGCGANSPTFGTPRSRKSWEDRAFGQQRVTNGVFFGPVNRVCRRAFQIPKFAPSPQLPSPQFQPPPPAAVPQRLAELAYSIDGRNWVRVMSTLGQTPRFLPVPRCRLLSVLERIGDLSRARSRVTPRDVSVRCGCRCARRARGRRRLRACG